MDILFIYQELQTLGITANYKGRKQIALSVQLAMEDEDRLHNVVKEIYWVVADQIGCDRSDIERNIRTAIRAAWKTNPKRLQELAGYPMYAPPSSSELLSILTTYFMRRLKSVETLSQNSR